ncbi:MAG TPA: DUF2892 domain-containing protein [Planctomycetota bacterium]|nr:DUF2892 domain-containing protein [Planctomycetota bacterium]
MRFTGRLTHERAGRALAGGSVVLCLALAWLASPWFLLGAAGTALNLIISAITDRCAVKSLLIGLGLPGERDLGRAEALAGLEAAPAAEQREPSARRTGSKLLAERLGVNVN